MEENKIRIKRYSFLQIMKVVMWSIILMATFFVMNSFADNLDNGLLFYVEPVGSPSEACKIASASLAKKLDIISFVGDIYPSDNQVGKAYEKSGDINNVIDKYMLNTINQSDYTVGNLECAISDRGTPFDKKYTFRIQPKYTEIIKKAGIDLLTLANNHTLDYGEEALKDTMKNLQKYDIEYMGAGDNTKEASALVEKNINGRKYLFFTASMVAPTHKWFATEDKFGLSNGYYLYDVYDNIKKAKEEDENVICIVYMHWGEEKSLVSDISQRKAAEILVKAGADLIVGSHSHTFQNIEYINHVPVIYSLGNFIYGATVTDTLILSAYFIYDDNNDREIALKITPGISGRETVKTLPYKKDRDLKVLDFLKTSNTCRIDKDLYIGEILSR